MHDPNEERLPRPPLRGIRWGRWLILALWGAAAAGGYGVYSGAIAIPAHLHPWAPLEVMAQPNFLTPYKLARARSEPQRCLTALKSTGMDYDVLPDRVTGDGCGFENAVRLRTAAVRFGAPLPLSCPLALSFFMWDRHALQPAALARTGQRVVGIDQLGSYACRNVNRGEGAAPGNKPSATSRSRHATADALDVAGFTLADGRHISVLRHWDAQDGKPLNQMAPTAALLRDAHGGACRYFKGVLGPDYNTVHRDHFHLETGGFSMCH